MIAFGLRHAQNFATAAQHLELMRAKIVLFDFVIAGFAEMRTGRSDDWDIAQLACVQSGVHDAVVGQRADVDKVGAGFVQGFGESRYAKRWAPMLRLPAPVGHQTQQASGATVHSVVADGEALNLDSVDDNRFFRKRLEAGQPERFQIVGDGGEDGGAMAFSN